MPRPTSSRQVPWPTDEMLERFGMVRCEGEGCSTWVNPIELPKRLCMSHARQARSRNRADRCAGRVAA